MKRIPEVGARCVVVVVAVRRLPAFLYFIPPFLITPPEAFGKAGRRRGAGGRRDIADPAERAIAERGRYLVMTRRLHRLPRDERPAGAGLHEVPRRRRR